MRPDREMGPGSTRRLRLDDHRALAGASGRGMSQAIGALPDVASQLPKPPSRIVVYDTTSEGNTVLRCRPGAS
jgi:hypothetical protein